MNETANQLVSGQRLLEIVFEQAGRPSLRWLKYQQSEGNIPYLKVGRRTFFDPAQVRETLAKRFCVETREEVRVGRQRG